METGLTLPQIVLTDRDHRTLASLVFALSEKDRSVAEYLADELERAVIVPQSDIAPDVVAMNSRVAFRDDSNGRVLVVRLVLPREADIATGRLSVLTPIGAALIGLTEGDSIEWKDRNGNWRMLTVLTVS